MTGEVIKFEPIDSESVVLADVQQPNLDNSENQASTPDVINETICFELDEAEVLIDTQGKQGRQLLVPRFTPANKEHKRMPYISSRSIGSGVEPGEHHLLIAPSLKIIKAKGDTEGSYEGVVVKDALLFPHMRDGVARLAIRGSQISRPLDT